MTKTSLFSLEAEVAVLGAILLDSSKFPKAKDILKAEDFYDQRHQAMYRAIVELHERNESIEILTVNSLLKTKGLPDFEEAYTFEVADRSIVPKDILSCAEIVQKKAVDRKIIKTLSELQTAENPQETLAKMLPRLAVFCKEPSRRNKAIILELNEFIALSLPTREFILSPWLPTQGLAMIYALPGIGKTHLGLNIAFTVATGRDFLNWNAPKGRGVLYLDGEMAGHDLQMRIQTIINSTDKSQEHFPFKILTADLQTQGLIDLATYEDQSSLEHALDGIELIIVDNISTLCRSGKENEAEGWLPIQQWALRMKASGRSVLFIHHAGKSGNQRGTSKRVDVLDTVITLKRPDDYQSSEGAIFEIHYEKTRGFYGEAAKPLLVEMSIVDNKQSWKTTKIKEKSFDKVNNLLNAGLSQSDIVKELGLNKSTVSRHVKKSKGRRDV